MGSGPGSATVFGPVRVLLSEFGSGSEKSGPAHSYHPPMNTYESICLSYAYNHWQEQLMNYVFTTNFVKGMQQCAIDRDIIISN